jgi:hypothetical protein
MFTVTFLGCPGELSTEEEHLIRDVHVLANY